jgi:hypothetical protein
MSLIVGVTVSVITFTFAWVWFFDRLTQNKNSKHTEE